MGGSIEATDLIHSIAVQTPTSIFADEGNFGELTG